jgi:CheY-like chemotaxis protein
VLVVDDEPLVADSLRLVLSDEFYVTMTTDPRQALEWILSDEAFDVVLCDVMMPQMNGVQLRDRVAAVDEARAADVRRKVVYEQRARFCAWDL